MIQSIFFTNDNYVFNNEIFSVLVLFCSQGLIINFLFFKHCFDSSFVFSPNQNFLPFVYVCCCWLSTRTCTSKKILISFFIYRRYRSQSPMNVSITKYPLRNELRKKKYDSIIFSPSNFSFSTKLFSPQI